MTVAPHELAQNWDEVSRQVKDRWPQVTQDDITNSRGSTELLLSNIQRKTGQPRAEIEGVLAELIADDPSLTQRAADAARQVAESVGDQAASAQRQLGRRYDRLTAQATDYSRRIDETVRNRPVSSLAIAFGVGLASGALMFLGRRQPEPSWSERLWNRH